MSNLEHTTETKMADIKTLVNKAVARAELRSNRAGKNGWASIMTTVQFFDQGGLKLTQLGAGSVTLTQGQLADLMERVAAMMLREQMKAGRV